MNEEQKSFDVKEAVEKALTAIQLRSFAGRHPELGKMVKCQVCNKRHREPVCKSIYAMNAEGQPRIVEGVGRAPFTKKRFHPHPNKRGLQLVQRTQQLFEENHPYISDPQDCMEYSRMQAGRELKKEWEEERKKKRKTQKESRRANRG